MMHVTVTGRLVPILVLVATIAGAPALADSPAETPFTVRACAEPNLSLATDAEGGAFDGMAHSGVMVTLKNTSAAACSISRRPSFRFDDAMHAPVAVVRQSAPSTIGMHPGPEMVPVVLAPGASTTSTIEWQSSNVTDGGRCASVAELALTFAPVLTRSGSALPLTTPQSAHLCGPADPASITFDATDWTSPVAPSPAPAASGS